MSDLVVANADLGGPGLQRIRVRSGTISAVGPDLEIATGDEVLDADGGGVLPGLHDHHVHLLAAAAARSSVRLGPPEVASFDDFAWALREAARTLRTGAWIRGVGYHESVAGPIDRDALDRIVVDRPVRVQDRTGRQWVLNTRALEIVGLTAPTGEGVEVGLDGRPTGRLSRMDVWLRDAMDQQPPSLDQVGVDAARFGVTGFTDATPCADVASLQPLARARSSGELRQRVCAMTAPGVIPDDRGLLEIGPTKVLLDDETLPVVDELADVFGSSHLEGRPVAVHCVTRVQLIATLTALGMAGSMPGDRIEHGALIPVDLVPELLRLGVTVVTNPGFVFDRGDRYGLDVEPQDQTDLYRCRSLIALGVRMAAGTDAPFGPADPWEVMRAAVSRTTRSGALLGPDEAISAPMALSLFLGSADRPSVPRSLVPGSPGDLCILSVPLSQALEALSASNVAATVAGGVLIAGPL
ncbi:MAG: amidohydrolase family protein [Acidimicrobiales bacterium]